MNLLTRQQRRERAAAEMEAVLARAVANGDLVMFRSHEDGARLFRLTPQGRRKTGTP
jgi:hypothetical protein